MPVFIFSFFRIFGLFYAFSPHVVGFATRLGTWRDYYMKLCCSCSRICVKNCEILIFKKFKNHTNPIQFKKLTKTWLEEDDAKPEEDDTSATFCSSVTKSWPVRRLYSASRVTLLFACCSRVFAMIFAHFLFAALALSRRATCFLHFFRTRGSCLWRREI